MKIILFVVFIALMVFCVPFRVIVLNPLKSVYNALIDLFRYFTRYFFIPTKPFINVYVGLFGSGKTLSAVHDAILFYETYNNRKVYDDRFERYVTQKVMILSNVELKNIKYRKFVSMKQIIQISKTRHLTDKRKHQRTITIVILDEASVQMNSRSFRDNLNLQSLQALLQSRHSLIHGFYLTSQRFEHMDALLRQISTNVIGCEKRWRVMKNTYYDAYAMEHCPNPTELKPIQTVGWFVRNRDYRAYDTLKVVDNLVKSWEDKDMLTEKETIDLQGTQSRYAPKQQKKKRGR